MRIFTSVTDLKGSHDPEVITARFGRRGSSEELQERTAVRVLHDALDPLLLAHQALSEGQIADADTHVATTMALLENADDPRRLAA